ncbi:MAG: rhamnulokinase [Planctomycetes bacterium]|nr:rhamnulokinase [Planctomycetota bacterium]
MQDKARYIAVDLGAESGRVMLATIEAGGLSLEEISRFGNGPTEINSSLRWNFQKLFSNIKEAIAKAVKQADGEISGIGVDSWGVDFGLLDENGELIEDPYHYRDSRTNGMMEKAFELLDKRSIYENTGLQFMQLNTIYQLLAMRLADSQVLKKAKKLVFMADLVTYFLSGKAVAEYSLASTSQLMDMRTGAWSKEIFDKLALPTDIMPDVVKPATVVGVLKPQLCSEFGCGPIDIIAVGSHDTACAVVAVPAQQENWAYLSSGTWSLLGIETPKAIINDKSFKYPFTNEGGAENTIRFLKNIMGLWLLQECRRQWQRDGVELSYDEITALAEKAEPFFGIIDPDYNDFLAPGDMPARINEYLKKTGQPTTDDKGQIARVILESLAIKYRSVIEAIEDITGQGIDVLHIIGGGIQNKMLCRFAADSTGKKVIAGPIEATAIGNVMIQAIAKGQIQSLADARKIVANSIETTTYLPQESKI